MKLLPLVLATATLMTSASYAQDAAVPATTAAPPAPTIQYTTSAFMPTLVDAGKQDTFTTKVTDEQMQTTLALTCTAGHTEMMFVRKDKVCAFQKESVGNLKIGQKWVPRTQYLGAYSVTADGTTDAGTMSVNYSPVGKVPASTEQFKGSLRLKPELASSGAQAMKDAVLGKLSLGSDTPVNTEVDTIDFNHFCLPSAGRPNDKGACFTGNMVFPYQNYSWYVKMTVEFNGKSYEFSGNMPFTDSVDPSGAKVSDQTEYNITLTLPSADTATDDALFASTDADADLFSTVDGISGKIIMKNSNNVNVKVGDETINTPENVEASGTLTGTNVPLEVVRDFGLIIGLLPSTFFGA